jgi:hypothetical protein
MEGWVQRRLPERLYQGDADLIAANELRVSTGALSQRTNGDGIILLSLH